VAAKSRTEESFMGKITHQQQLLLQAYTISYVLSAAFMDLQMAYSIWLVATKSNDREGNESAVVREGRHESANGL
jgi:hypothetical protein